MYHWTPLLSLLLSKRGCDWKAAFGATNAFPQGTTYSSIQALEALALVISVPWIVRRRDMKGLVRLGRGMGQGSGARRALSQATGSSSVLLEVTKNKIGIVTFNDPNRLNAMTVSMGERFGQVIDEVHSRLDEIHAVVFTGAGKAFSAGGDLKFLQERAVDSPSRNVVIMRDFYNKYVVKARTLPIPLIAAINGPAVGAGLAFAAGCDLRIASKSAKMGVTFTSLNLHPGMGTTHFFPRLIGPQYAARMILTGELISGEEAARIGLVLSAEEEGEVLAKALALAEKIAAQGPIAVRSTVRTLRMHTDEGLDRSLWREADAQSYCYASEDLKEGVQAVAEKRKPSFTHFEKYDP
jgi:enoyl-CoA hydratase/carnithine racemase